MAEPDDLANEAAFLGGGGATGALVAEYAWEATPLGPLNAWPQCLKTATAMVLHSPVAMALLWGEDGVMIYNDSYAEIAGARHPQLLGAKVREGWPEIADFGDHAMKAVLGEAALQYRDKMFTLRRWDKPEQVWFNLDYSPVPDESGRIAGVLAIVVETTDRVRTERKAAVQAERQRRMFEQAPGFIAFLSGPNHRFEFRNDAHKRLFGDRDVIGKSRNEVFADRPDNFRELLDHAYATGERYVARALRVPLRPLPGGPIREAFLDFVLEPMTNDAGEVTGIFVEGFDVTEQVRAQAAVEESNRRLSAAIAVARLGVYEFDQETRTATLDDRAREIYGIGPDESLTIEDVTGRIDSRDLPRIAAAAAAADAGGRRRVEFEYRVHLPDGSIRNVVSINDRLLGPDGRVRRVVGVFDDVTERRRAEQRQRLLINELNHRVKNTLATVQSIAAQTLRTAKDLPSARDAFEARLMALAAAQNLLNREAWRGARLTDVAASAMEPFEITHRPQISRSGPPVWLTAHRALALSLVLNELAANAARYGALSRPQGRVMLRWNQTADGKLTLSWIEEGSTQLAPPARSGFGTRLLQRSLVQELQGEVSLTFGREGVRCSIRCDVADGRVAATPELAEA